MNEANHVTGWPRLLVVLRWLVVRGRWRFLRLLRSRSRSRPRLSLHPGFVHRYRLFLGERRSLRNEVEVCRLALGAALARFQTRRVKLRPDLVRGQVVLDVHRDLGPKK